MANQSVQVCTDSLCRTSGCQKVEGNPTPCHCDYACYFFNDCCADYFEECTSADSSAFSGEPEEDIRFRQSVEGLSRDQLSCVHLRETRRAYLMVVSCPSGWTDENVRSKCDVAKSQVIPDVGAIPVMSFQSITYRNVYCAICNGVELGEGLRPWTLELSCPPTYATALEQDDRLVRKLLVSGVCKLEIAPPANASSSVVRACTDVNYIDTCPRDAQKVLVEKCNLFSAVFKHNSKVYYRNPYCKLCNADVRNQVWTQVEQDNTVDRICSLPEESTTGGGEGEEGGGGGGGLTPISVLVDFTGNSGVSIFYSRSRVVETAISCQLGEVYNFLLDTCVAVTCAPGYTLQDEHCTRDALPRNLTCGYNNSDLEVMLETKVATSLAPSCVDGETFADMASCVLSTLSLSHEYFSPIATLPTYHGNYSHTNTTDCNVEAEQDFVVMKFRVYSDLFSYAQLEDTVDNAIRTKGIHAQCPIKEIVMYQKCDAVQGLQLCPTVMARISNVTFQEINGTSFAKAESTDILYHPYETLLTAEYRWMGTRRGYSKELSVRVCDKGSFLLCPTISRNASSFKLLNGTSEFLLDTINDVVLGPHEYMVTALGSVQICVPDEFEQNVTINRTVVETVYRYDHAQVILSYAGVCISLVALSFTFLTYSAFPALRQCVSNKLIMAFCLVLFAAQLLQLLNGFGTVNRDVCMGFAILGHFLWLLVFSLTSALAIELNKTFGDRDTFALSAESSKVFLWYLAFAVAFPCAVVVTCISMHFTIGKELNFSYGSDRLCWVVDNKANLIAFGCPLGGCLLLNALLFLHTVRGIRYAARMRSRLLQQTSSLQEKGNELRIYLKISTLLGFTWLFGFVAAYARVGALWYVFIVLNSLQGLYIFLAFTANRTVLDLWVAKMQGKKVGRTSLRGRTYSDRKSTTMTMMSGTTSNPSEQRISYIHSTEHDSRTSTFIEPCAIEGNGI
ncbi:uncharacterized protein [Diadema antillarum]|uniref:uncharacterized protein n=1 Tax=Diadema antillarum TaxID=105358 RepID=UPI003A86AB32